VLTRFFTHTDETDEQLDALAGAAFGIMTGVLKPLGTALTRLPFGPGSPGHTAGAAFQMYYQIGNFVPWREAAWLLLSERAAILSRQCAETARHAGVPDAVSSAAAAAAEIARQIAESAGTDKARAASLDGQIEPTWKTIEDTVKQNDQNTYLAMEDNFAVLEKAADEGDAAAAAKGSAGVSSAVQAYLAKYSG